MQIKGEETDVAEEAKAALIPVDTAFSGGRRGACSLETSRAQQSVLPSDVC